MKPLEHLSLHCIFCDDIRAELEGKTTLVGWYAGEPNRLPEEGALLIPTLGVVGMLAMPLTPKHKSIKMEFLQDEHVLQSTDMPEQALQEMQVEEAPTCAPLLGRQVRIVIKISSCLRFQSHQTALHKQLNSSVRLNNARRWHA